MRNIRKYLVLAIVFLSVGILGLITTSILGGNYDLYNGEFCWEGFWGGRNFGWTDNMMEQTWYADKETETNSYSFNEVRDRVEGYLEKYGLTGLEITEIMEFSQNYYIEVIEEDTSIGAMELLLDKKSGAIFPEYGPNMMWNQKYGMHAIGDNIKDMTVDEEEAISLGQEYLDASGRDEYIGEETERFYGYYTIHTVDSTGNISGMLSVNGYTGDVWYHVWHGQFISIEEYDEH